jgi:DNA-binding CsgD family transcriptional regulator/DNA-binding transcriptional ArsR family regulator
MTSPFERPLVSPVLVGRAEEMAALGAAAETIATGQGGLLLLSGEAGVGKSRLVSELLDSPAAVGCRRIRVACLESDLAEPYALALEIARAAGKPGIDLLPDGAAAEARVRRVQHALQAILTPEAESRPLILVAEDIHWSDSPSLSVLLGLAQRPGRMLLLATYRPEGPSPGLSGFLAEAGRIQPAREIRLRALARVDVARMVQEILELDTPVPGALLDEIMAATDGNPFLVEEALRSWVEIGAIERDGSTWRRRPGVPLQAPDSLRHAIDARLARLPDEVVTVAERAAVVSQLVSVEFLSRLCGLDGERLSAALRALRDAQILERRIDGTLAFRHALTRQAVLARLLQPERHARHRQVAELLESSPESTPAALAYHWSQAGEPTRAALYALRAAERAASLHAHREAARFYELARAGGAGPRAELLASLADQHVALGELDQAIPLYEEAQAIHRAEGSSTEVARLDLRMGIAFANDRERAASIAHLESAFSGLLPDDPDRWRAGLALGVQIAATGRYDVAEETLARIEQASYELDQLTRLRVTYELGGLRALRGNWQALADAAESVLRETPDTGDDEILAFRDDAHAALGTVAYYRGSFEDAVAHFSACKEIAGRRGVAAAQAIARWNLATNALYNLGRWREARVELGELQALGTVNVAESAAWVEAWLDGRWEQALDDWLQAWPEMIKPGDLEVQTAHGRRIADILLALGRTRQALDLLEDVLARIRAVQARSFELQLTPREAEALARLGDPRALPACDTGLDLARQLGARPAEGLLLRARALAHGAAGAWQDAFADCEAAVELLNELPMPYEAARTLREAGLLRLARRRRGDRDRAADVLRTAQQAFADIGATRDEAATTGILSAAGLASEADRGSGPLTAREREVAGLVAEGLSNRDIAERLFITEKTAAYHVGSILTKLDFDSRAQIAAYVVRGDRG